MQLTVENTLSQSALACGKLKTESAKSANSP